jgi:hypothetical protein
MKMPDELPKKQEVQESEAKIEASIEQQVEAMGREIAADAANLSSELEADARKASSEEAKSELRGLAAEASQVAEDFSAEVAEAKGEQRESVRETYEYRDAEGKLIVTAEAEFESATEDDLRAAHLEGGRILRSLVLKGEGGVGIDVLALAKAKDRKIFIPNQRQDNYYFSETGQVMAPPLENLLDVGVMLHELGHAAQYNDEGFSVIKNFYDLGKQSVDSVSLGVLNEIMSALPETQALAPMLAEFKPLREKVDSKTAEISDKRSEIVMLERGLRKDVAKLMGRTLPFKRELEESHYDSKAEARKALEKMGITVSDEKPEALEKRQRKPFTLEELEEDEDVKKPEPPPLCEDDLSADGLFAIQTALFRSFPIDTAQIDYDAAAHSLSLRLQVNLFYGTEERSMSLKAPFSPEDFAALQEMRQTAARKIATAQAEIARLEEEVAAARDRMKALSTLDEFKRLINMPRRVMERDATRRAFQWLRKVKQATGADVFSQIKADAAHLKLIRKDDDKSGGCEGSMVSEAMQVDIEGKVSVKDYLATAYGTYGATLENMRIKKSGETGPGKMPRPKKKE